MDYDFVFWVFLSKTILWDGINWWCAHTRHQKCPFIHEQFWTLWSLYCSEIHLQMKRNVVVEISTLLCDNIFKGNLRNNWKRFSLKKQPLPTIVDLWPMNTGNLGLSMGGHSSHPKQPTYILKQHLNNLWQSLPILHRTLQPSQNWRESSILNPKVCLGRTESTIFHWPKSDCNTLQYSGDSVINSPKINS